MTWKRPLRSAVAACCGPVPCLLTNTNFAPPTAPFTPDAATLALYHFDEGAGQVAADASGNGHDLTLGTSIAVETPVMTACDRRLV